MDKAAVAKTTSSKIVDVENLLVDKKHLSNKIAIGDKLSSERLLFLAVKYKLKHIIQRSASDRETQLLSSKIMLQFPKLFFDFPLSTIITPKNVKLSTEKNLKEIELKFKKAEQKDKALETLVAYLSKYTKDKSLILDVKLVADELMCNALYNAPSANKKKSKTLPPSTKAAPIKTAKLFMGLSDSNVIIGCDDAYGTLDVLKLLERVQDCFKRGDNGPGISNLGNEGAGLGTFMVFGICNSMYIGVHKNSRTLVCCSIARNSRSGTKALYSKSLHLIAP